MYYRHLLWSDPNPGWLKLGMCAEKNWRRLRGFNDLAKVITGVKFKDGVEVTEDNQVAA